MLTPRDVAYVACRLLAFTLVVLGIGRFFGTLTLIVTQLWETYQLGSDWTTSILIALLTLMVMTYFGLMWLVWSNAGWISHKLVPEERNSAIWPRVRLIDLQVAAYSAIGLVFFIYGIETMASLAVNIVRVLRMMNPDYALTDWLFSGDMFSALTRTVLGLILMIRSRGIVRLINSLRTAGRPEIEESDAEPPMGAQDAEQA